MKGKNVRISFPEFLFFHSPRGPERERGHPGNDVVHTYSLVMDNIIQQYNVGVTKMSVEYCTWQCSKNVRNILFG